MVSNTNLHQPPCISNRKIHPASCIPLILSYPSISISLTSSMILLPLYITSPLSIIINILMNSITSLMDLSSVYPHTTPSIQLLLPASLLDLHTGHILRLEKRKQ